MMQPSLSPHRILSKLDEHLHRNDYGSAEQYLLRCLEEATTAENQRVQLLVRNELMGLYRKLGQKDRALAMMQGALDTVECLGAEHPLEAATTYLNAATVCKAFGAAAQGLPLFEKAQSIYERALPSDDQRLAGLYNNMALALTDLGRFDEADAYNHKAITIMLRHADGAPEAAISYLNLASNAEAQLGLEAAETIIGAHLHTAQELLERHQNRDGNYAFVCEKCASVFGYYGYFAYAKELSERAKKIYEGP